MSAFDRQPNAEIIRIGKISPACTGGQVLSLKKYHTLLEKIEYGLSCWFSMF